MELDKLQKLASSSEAPYNHSEFVIWLHNKIVEDISYEVWQYREKKGLEDKSGYVAANRILGLQSLKLIR